MIHPSLGARVDVVGRRDVGDIIEGSAEAAASEGLDGCGGGEGGEGGQSGDDEVRKHGDQVSRGQGE